jgi:hypothetical protein
LVRLTRLKILLQIARGVMWPGSALHF